MKALLKRSRAAGDLILEELPIPEVESSLILADVLYAGICGSDLDILNNKTSIYQPPVVPGHEFCAKIVSVGPEVKNFKVGDVVVSETTKSIQGEKEGHKLIDYHLHKKKEIIGWTVNGGFAEKVLLNSYFCHLLSPHVNLKAGALAEPLAIGAESVFVKGNLKPNERVVIIGPGPIGIMCALLAHHFGGAKDVVLIGTHTDKVTRLPLAQNLEIPHCLVNDQNLEALMPKSHNSGADLVIDATGNIEGFRTALKLIKKNGRLVEVGSITEDTMFSWEHAAFLSLNLFFVFSSSHRAWKMAIEFLNSTTLELSQLVTGVFELHDFKKAFEAAADPYSHMKVLLKPN